MGSGHALIVIAGQLAYMCRHGDRQTARRVDVTKEYIGDSLPAFLPWIIGREQCIGMLSSPILLQRTPFNINYHKWFACLFQGS